MLEPVRTMVEESDHPAAVPVATVRDSRSDPRTPLAVDLDGSLLRSDLLIESLFVLARQRPLQLLRLPLWWLGGRARLKRKLAQLAMPDIYSLPYRTEVLGYLREQKAMGRTLVLATAADERLARAIAAHLDLFDAVLASDGHRNLGGQAKRAALAQRFGEHAFDYLGNSCADLPAWRSARAALLVDPSRWLRRQVAGLAPVERVFKADHAGGTALLLALRPHHWVKNLLLFLPLLLAARTSEPQMLLSVAFAFAAFSLCASSVYLLNDLLDLPSDRRHPQKKSRPLASGRVPLIQALLLMPLLLAAALALAATLGTALSALLAAYFGLMLLYSLGLKDIPLLDVLVLAAGYTMRVVAGALVIGLPPPPWLLAVTGLLFFSLALIKRYSELTLMATHSVLSARGYRVGDGGVLAAQGVAAGYLAILISAMHANDGASGSHWHWMLHLLLFYWLSYLWLMAQRGRMPHDPLLFAITDRVSFSVLAAIGLIAVLA